MHLKKQILEHSLPSLEKKIDFAREKANTTALLEDSNKKINKKKMPKVEKKELNILSNE
jgi:hypothetical protein